MFAEEVADYLTMAIVNIASVVDPEVVVLGGSCGRKRSVSGPCLLLCADLVPSPPEIVVSGLGQDAGVLGGVAALRRLQLTRHTILGVVVRNQGDGRDAVSHSGRHRLSSVSDRIWQLGIGGDWEKWMIPGLMRRFVLL